MDATLAAAGDSRAFERLYRAHAARIFSLARRMLGAAEAAEATQDVFVRAWGKLGTFRGESAFGTWLHRLAVRAILSRRAATRRDWDRHEPDEGAIEAVPAPPAGRELAMDFESAIGRLPRGAREIFVLHDVEGYRHDEIARLLGVSEGTSKSQLHRARLLMRVHLER